MTEEIRAVRALVVRLFVPAGKFLPEQQYLTADETWGDRKAARSFSYSTADTTARKLTSSAVHVFPVLINRETDPQHYESARQSVRDWHEGKPNCGVD